MSRKGIDRSDFSLHPFGLAHGPQPAMTEASIGKTETQELAVMMDTFHPSPALLDAMDERCPHGGKATANKL